MPDILQRSFPPAVQAKVEAGQGRGPTRRAIRPPMVDTADKTSNTTRTIRRLPPDIPFHHAPFRPPKGPSR